MGGGFAKAKILICIGLRSAPPNLLAKPETWAIFSGILLEQSKAVADALEQNGWVVATLWKRKEWCCLNVRRS